MKKCAGILLHISSLKGDNIGTLGKEAYEFVDFLYEAKQHLWQVLPINPTSYGDSPYQSPSTFAYNPYFISLEELYKEGLLDEYNKDELGSGINYYTLFTKKLAILKKAYKNVSKVRVKFNTFKRSNAYWLDDYAAFQLLKEKNNYKPWYEWENYKYYKENEIDNFIQENKKEIDEIKFIQFLFYSQWSNLKKYANERKIKIIGDIPIYVAYDSVDVWKNPNLFELNNDLKPINVAGCPPDYFSSYGQLWGNPVYRWNYIKATNYDWWVKRIKHTSKVFDVIRIDHFRGFAGYYSIPYGKDPCDGRWEKGPGIDLFKEINKHVKCEIIAENLGFLDDSVHDLLRESGYAGMNVMQFEFGDKLEYKKGYPYNHVLYTGTHDNENLAAWYESFWNKKNVSRLCKIGPNNKHPYLRLIESCMEQNSKYVIVPMQDYLGLKNARMNVPSEFGGNWTYQMKGNELTRKLANTIREMTLKTKRAQY